MTVTEIGCRIVYLEFRDRSRMSERLALIEQFDRGEGAQQQGFRGTAEWLASECKLTPRTARDQVRVAKRLVSMPRVAEALGAGRLSYSQVRAITRACESEDEGELLRVALTSSTSELERHIRQLRSSRSADLDVANRGRARRSVTWFWDREDGSLRFFGRLDAVDGAVFVEAVETGAEAIDPEAGDPCCTEGHSRPPLRARRADALAELARGGGVRTHLVLEADPASLACQARDRQARGGKTLALREGPAIPSEIARRLTCDADVSIKGLNLGRTTRTVTPAQRRALEARDGRVCAMPGCERTHGLQAHHLKHWINGGRTDLVNLALFCLYHHRLFHDDGWTVRRRGDGTLRIRDPHGRELDQLRSRGSPLLAAA